MATHNKTNIRCGLINIQSVRNKTFDIRDLINRESFDILAVTETWLHEYESAVIHEMTPCTHTFIHIPRQNSRGGGVGVFLSKAFRKIKKYAVEQLETYEALRVDCDMNGNKITLIIVYRPPCTSKSSFIEELRTYLDCIDMVSADVIVCGDFNIWLDDPSARYVSSFLDMMDSFGLANVVNEPTSIGGHTIDLVFADKRTNLVQDVQVEDSFRLSPVHKLIYFSLRLQIERKQKMRIRFRSKKKFNSDVLLETIYESVLSQSLEACVHGSDIKGQCLLCLDKLFNDISKDRYEQMCPIVEKEIVIIDSSPWYNEEVDRAKKLKKRKERQWRRSKTELSRREYTSARNNEKKVIIARKREYYQNKAVPVAGNLNKLYKILDNLTGKKKRKRLPEGFLDCNLANDFINFFDTKIYNITRSFRDDSDDYFPLWAPVPNNRLTSFTCITLESLQSIVKRSKPTHCAHDPLPFGELLHSGNIDLLMKILVDLVNLSLTSHIFPDIEKRAIVKPILKGALDSQCLSSYRPVSNLTFLSKIIENAILEQLCEHMELVEALPDNQSAYRRLYSTETALCAVVNDMQVLMDEGRCGILILLDLSAAFDTVVHDILLRDCESLGIEGQALAFLKSYLQNRTYCVQIGDAFSQVGTLERGVPQGSVLGPILFCIYTIGLSHLLAQHGVAFKLYADDTQFYLSLEGVQDTEMKISAIMVEIVRWMNHKQLKLNESKTKCLVIGRKFDVERYDVRHLHVNGQTMSVNSVVKNLGIFLDANLSFETQIQHTVRMSNYHLKNLAFVKKYLDQNQMLMLIHNHVISKLDYCCSLYYSVPNYMLRKLQLVMNRAARLIEGLSRRDRITPALIRLHWLPIKARIVFKMCVIVYQALKSGRPRYIRELLSSFHAETTVTLRHHTEQHRLAEPSFNTEVGRKAFSRSAPRLYNLLPSTVKQADNVAIFKKRLKTYLFNQCYDLKTMTIKEHYRC